MFDSLSSKLETTFKKLTGRGKLNEEQIDEALKEIKASLLEADVNFKVTKEFCEKVKAKTLGEEVVKSLSPGQTVIKFVQDELINVMGEHEEVNFKFAPPVILMLVGLQGSGKTTSCGKLAKHIKEDLKRTQKDVDKSKQSGQSAESIETEVKDVRSAIANLKLESREQVAKELIELEDTILGVQLKSTTGDIGALNKLRMHRSLFQLLEFASWL